MARDIKKLVSKMTLEEKARMCSGNTFWALKSVERLGIPEVMLSDGPHGLRTQKGDEDHLGVFESIKAVCFPAGCATACSFDRELIEKMGEYLGEECQAEDVSVLLGPAVNIKRSPLCGRNFEYFSEDPYLAGEIAASHINGVQSKNVGTSIKHFACNSQEYRRMSCSSEVDERTLREIYLSGFERAIKQAKPWTVMCAYNQVNGTFCSENKHLLTEILRDEWGFDGYVMSDWGAVNKRVKGVEAGLDLEMPTSYGTNDKEIVEAVKDGSLDEKVLDKTVERILDKIFKFCDNRIKCEFDRDKHHAFAKTVAENSIVLLKNNGILPLSAEKKIAFIGKFASEPRYQGGGSSHINASKVSDALTASKEFTSVAYAQGYDVEKDVINEKLFAEAVETAKNAEIAVIFAGLPDAFESESYDRSHMRLPDCQTKLIEEISKVQKNIVVVLHNGSPVEMPWIDDVSAVLEVYLCGQAVGEATSDILFGKVNPSGKLAETFPLKLEDNPSYLNFGGDGKTVNYSEGIFVGYRYYDKKKMNVLFPFGHGLSYTTFEYSNLKVNKSAIKDTETVTVSVDVTNTGSVDGKEIVQLYVSDLTGEISRPEKELKGFEKVSLKAGETKTVSFVLDKRAFAWYNTEISDWCVSDGEYRILVGKSSRDIVLSASVNIERTVKLPACVTEITVIGDILNDERIHNIGMELIRDVLGATDKDEDDLMMINTFENMPLRTIRNFANNFSNEKMAEYIERLNNELSK